jgi:hypothetical protein
MCGKPTKARKFEANRIEKMKEKIILGEDLGVEWIVKRLSFSILQHFTSNMGVS